MTRFALILARGQALTMERQREVCGLLGPILDRQGETGYMTNEGGGPAAAALLAGEPVEFDPSLWFAVGAGIAGAAGIVNVMVVELVTVTCHWPFQPVGFMLMSVT